MSRRQSRIFVGSSNEGYKVVEALQVLFADDHQVIPWKHGVFGLSSTTIESLERIIKTVDFAILVLTPDDARVMRDKSGRIPRDNVVFELGMFIGALGRQRTFMVSEYGANLNLPTDLLGITAATFRRSKHQDLRNSLARARLEINAAIRDRGLREIQDPSIMPRDTLDKLHHVSLPVKNLARSIKFYTEVVGLKKIARPDFGFPGAWLRVPGGGELHLVENKKGTFRRRRKVDYRDVHFAMCVKGDFREVLGRMHRKDPKINPEPDPTLARVTGRPQAYFQDPDNHIIEINAFGIPVVK